MLIDDIKNRIASNIRNCKIKIIDESHMHAGHKNNRQGSAHFKAVIISEHFENLSLIERHKKIYAILGSDMGTTIHAFSMKTFTPDEYKSIINKQTLE